MRVLIFCLLAVAATGLLLQALWPLLVAIPVLVVGTRLAHRKILQRQDQAAARAQAERDRQERLAYDAVRQDEALRNGHDALGTHGNFPPAI